MSAIPTIKESRLIFDRFLKIYQEKLLLPDGSEHDYFTLAPPAEAVSIIAETSEGLFVLIEEYRIPPRLTLLGLPGGYIEKGESIIKAAERELLEEVGYRAETFRQLQTIYPYPGISSQALTVVYAQGAVKVQEPMLEPTETITCVLKSREALKAAAQAHVPLDGILCAALGCMTLEGLF
jgi:ADP-ribose pyrophosphatase